MSEVGRLTGHRPADAIIAGLRSFCVPLHAFGSHEKRWSQLIGCAAGDALHVASYDVIERRDRCGGRIQQE